MRLAIVIALLVAACSSEQRPHAPYVHIVLDRDNDLTPDSAYLNSAEGWCPLGFDFGTEPSGMPTCDRHWYENGATDCEITVYLFRVPQLATNAGTQALTDPDTRTISIDSSLDGWKLAVATAHEVGHIVLDTPTHTQGGIMGGDDDRMWDVDKRLACQTIHICI